MELITAAILWILAAQKGFWTWMALMILGSLVRTPTVALANALAFAHLADPRSRYPRLRAWGTIGWIGACAPGALSAGSRPAGASQWSGSRPTSTSSGCRRSSGARKFRR